MELIQAENRGYGLITLNRPDKHNAINLKMAYELKDALHNLKLDNPPFLVITGAGSTFCAGGDLNEFHGEMTHEEAFEKLSVMREVLIDIVNYPVPVICLLNGNAIGGGAELATACDFRIAINTAKCGFVQSGIGILPGWGGGALLYDKINANTAFYWLTSANLYDVSMLGDMGWIHNTIPKDEWNLVKVLTPFISRTSEQMSFLKKQYQQSASIELIEQNMLEESKKCSKLWGSKTHKMYLEKFKQR